MSGRWVPAIGLEVHVQLRTVSKMFCGCANRYGAEPNTLVCPVCLGYPGSMPVMNREAIRLTVQAGMLLGCRINRFSKFDRKSYFYPDMPKNYQISQYDLPLCEGGELGVDVGGQARAVRLKRIHLEEDVGKSMHTGMRSTLDFNRAGVPLMEIVTEPDIATPEEAFAFLQGLRRVLLYGAIGECNLERGNMRCDVNCSVRPAGQSALGTKTEIKNLNTFKGVQAALRFELARQEAALERGERIVQETRRWDADTGATYSMRSKEDAHDYRYFPEPDLLPVVLAADALADWERGLPELPRARKARFMETYHLPEYDAGVLVADQAVADFFEEVARASGAPKAASNWVMTEILRLLGAMEEPDPGALRITAPALARLIALTEGGTLNSTKAKEVFAVLVAEGGDPDAIVAARGLAQVNDEAAIAGFVERAIAENPKSVQDYLNGRTAAAKHLMGHVMRSSRGKANPERVTQMLEEQLRRMVGSG